MGEASDKPTAAFWITVVLTVAAFVAGGVVLAALFLPASVNPFFTVKE